jgi:predicted RNase H-like HicB family nuclease
MKYILVTVAVNQEGPHYVAECRELGTASFGATRDEAVRMVTEATALYLNTYEELGECERVLSEKGVALRTGDAISPSIMCPRQDSAPALLLV